MITITIKETGTSRNLQIINPQDNTDQTAEEITDALDFNNYDAETGSYIMSAETAEWWEDYCRDIQKDVDTLQTLRNNYPDLADLISVKIVETFALVNVNDFTIRHDTYQDAIGQVKAVILRKRLADNYRYYDEGEPSPVYCGGKSYTGWMYGNDECFEYNNDINDSEFYQLFVTVDGEVRKMYYEIPVDEDGEHLELDTINYDKPYRVGDDEAELWIDLD